MYIKKGKHVFTIAIIDQSFHPSVVLLLCMTQQSERFYTFVTPTLCAAWSIYMHTTTSKSPWTFLTEFKKQWGGTRRRTDSSHPSFLFPVKRAFTNEDKRTSKGQDFQKRAIPKGDKNSQPFKLQEDTILDTNLGLLFNSKGEKAIFALIFINIYEDRMTLYSFPYGVVTDKVALAIYPRKKGKGEGGNE